MARAWINPRSDGPGYTVYWYDANQKQRQRSFKKKVDAEKFRAKTERDLDTGVYIEAEHAGETITRLFARWATTRGLENSSVRQYRSMLNQAIAPYFKAKTIGALRQTDVQAWVLWMKDTKRYAPQTIQTRFGYLSSALQWAVVNQELGRNPAKGVKLPGRRANVRRIAKRKIIVPSLAEIDALAAAFDPRYAAMVWLMAGCGLRIGEVMGLCRDQIDFRKQILHVDRQITEDGETASGKNAGLRLKRYTKHRDEDTPGRDVPLPAIVARILRAHLREYGTYGLDQLLFPNSTRTGLIYQYFFRNQLWLPALKSARVSFIKTHALRHFFASSLLSRGVPITDVSVWLGHSNVEITYAYYGHLMPDAPERGRAAIDLAMQPPTDPENAGLPSEASERVADLPLDEGTDPQDPLAA
ncbi:tyrosine-type recombinase/integrase [Catenuloplanes japonicus]|uniref:tyrosine-type recombinase/integrase n=1 Tax=Catenuloplanes japonicus TaxID=33876 RepID=UPI0007C53897|nr:site-specific integrase [Catenuloplanes japonicus]